MPSTPDYRGKRVLVAGGLGFIGSNLAIALVERGAEVTVVDAMLPQYGARVFSLSPVRDRLRVNFSDLRDSGSLKYLVRGQEVIFNLAGQVSHLRSMEDPLTDMEINCHSHLSLLECCRRTNPEALVVVGSTRQVYGRPTGLPVDETHPTAPVDINGVHKLAAETYSLLYHRVHGVRTVILRLTNTFGPRMDLINGDKGVIGVFLGRALRGEKLQLYGPGTQMRDFNYVDDVVEALLLAGGSPALVGETFNLGHPRPRSLLDFVILLQQVTGCTFEHVPFPEDQRAIDIGDYWGNSSKFEAACGWQAKTELEPGIRATVGFFRQHAGEYLDLG